MASSAALRKKEVCYGGVKKLVKQYASTLVEGLVIAVAFAVVDGLRSNALTTVITGGVGLVVGAFLGVGIAERGKQPGPQE